MTRPDIDTAELIAEVEQLLVDAEEHAETMGSVCWDAVRVLDVQRRQSIMHDDTAFICVIVEEASPVSGLAAWLHEHLNRERWPGVFFECEW